MSRNRMTLEQILSWAISTNDYSEVIAFFYYEFIGSEENKYLMQQFLESNLSVESLFSLLRVFTVLMKNSAFNETFLKYAISNQIFDKLVDWIRAFENNESNIEGVKVVLKFYRILTCNYSLQDIYCEQILAIINMIYSLIDRGPFTCDSYLFQNLFDLKDNIERKFYIYENNIPPYTELDIYPSQFNLSENHPLTPNKTNEPYHDSEQYLDTQFKLLRADFFSALKDSISGMKNKNMEKCPDFNIYRNVRSSMLNSRRLSSFKFCHKLKFSKKDESILKLENWDNSKKLMNGSILLFTQDNFETFFVGVLEQNLANLTKGHLISLHVNVIGNPHQLKIDELYDMAEPRSFFEPYFQSMCVLQSMDPYLLPLADDIITLNNQIFPSRFSNNWIGFNNLTNNLNEPQMNAASAALLQKFTLIQGPPGTGKSYLTQEIIRILAGDRTDRRPVLLVCMRNRSLDRVLEPLARSGIRTLRFGQTESEFLKDFTFNKWMSHQKKIKKANTSFIEQRLSTYKGKLKNPRVVKEPNIFKEFLDLHNEASRAYKLSKDYCMAFNISSSKFQLIGATTTGAAKRHRMISQINPKAVIIEEAAEILEGSLISSIPVGCDHIIFVGDHFQLRPMTANHKMSQMYKMDVSLFERLVKNGKSYHCLSIQHRMRPEIAELICPLFYDNLTNDPSVYDFADIMGVAKNVFFIHHSTIQSCTNDSPSFSNPHEANFLLSLANYLLKQGYSASEITILAAYSSQMNYLIKNKDKYPLILDIQIETIDNYQGDENDIILMSLVRSKSPTIGFLKMPNRINVALSRARKGLYIIGNADTLTKHSGIWAEVLGLLKTKGSFGPSFPLKCKTHGKVTKVSKENEIDSLVLGGCNSVCSLPLPCGHPCKSKCHASLVLHQRFVCEEPCNRKVCDLHYCRKKCYEECGICPDHINLDCGHRAPLEFSLNLENYQCTQPCERLPCGFHKCDKLCHEECSPCTKTRNFPLECGHKAKLKCTSRDIRDLNYLCQKKCNRKVCDFHVCQKKCFEECGDCPEPHHINLECGHTAPIESSSNLENYQCTQPCERLPCGFHKCDKLCHEECSPCTKTRNFSLECGHKVKLMCTTRDIHDLDIWKKKCNSNTAGLFQNGSEPHHISLECGHTAPLEYSSNLENYQCTQPCMRLPCGFHKCDKLCHEECSPCTKTRNFLLECGHKAKLKCTARDISDLNYICQKKCKRKVCDIHFCQKKCFEECGDCPEPHHIDLECGHTAPLEYSSNLESYQCTQPCKRKVCDIHFCQKKCFEECGDCPEPHHINLECGHTAPLESSSNLENYKCTQPCERLPCGFHKCDKLCHEKCSPCTKIRNFSLECGHKVKLMCTTRDIHDLDIWKKKCNSNTVGLFQNGSEPHHISLECGHTAPLEYSSNLENYQCTQPCMRLPCGFHKCDKLCHEECSPCTKTRNFLLECGHKAKLKCTARDISDLNYICQKKCKRKVCDIHFCQKKCFEECGDCPEPHLIDLECGHTAPLEYSSNLESYQCTQPCKRKVCDIHFCQKKCFEECGDCPEPHHINLECGHTAPLESSSNLENYKCTQPCERLPCGFHKCDKLCHEKCSPCTKTRNFSLECGHKVKLMCTTRDIHDLDIWKKKCNSNTVGLFQNGSEPHHISLECGHTAPLEYSSNLENYQCTQPCMRLPCGFHKCDKLCHEECSPCTKTRNFLLECGHKAKLKCTARDISDLNYICQKKCKRKVCDIHFCQKKCFEECGDCPEPHHIDLECGHTAPLEYSSNLESYQCTQPCKRKVCDYHFCKKKCFEECGDCSEPHHIDLECGHRAPLESSSNLESYQCTQPCERLPCGFHKCDKLCHEECSPCTKTRNFPLECGHKAKLKCTTRDISDLNYSCQKKCKRKVCDFHYCKKKCFEECGDCTEPHHVDLECGHTVTLESFSNVENYKCTQPCERLPCGLHKCKKLCHEKCSPCKKYRKFPLDCGHTVYLKCTTRNISDISYICQKQCKKKPCGIHRCENKCNEPCGPCQKLILEELPCGHNTLIPCSQDIATYKCDKPCQRNTCAFHRCKKLCYEPCGPCQVLIDHTLKCGHVVRASCSLDCSTYKCKEICRRFKDCWHDCREVCHLGKCPPCQEFVSPLILCEHSMYIMIRCSSRYNYRCSEIVSKKYLECPHFYELTCSEDYDRNYNNKQCIECSSKSCTYL